jgi:hypothetical protein
MSEPIGGGSTDRDQMIGIRKYSFDLEFTHLEGVESFRAHPSTLRKDEISSTARAWALNCFRAISFAAIDKSLSAALSVGEILLHVGGIPKAWEPQPKRRVVPPRRTVQPCALP